MTAPNESRKPGRAVITLSVSADFFDGPESRDGVQHSIRFTLDDPGLPAKDKRPWGPGEVYGYQLGKLARSLEHYLCDFDALDKGFLRGSRE